MQRIDRHDHTGRFPLPPRVPGGIVEVRLAPPEGRHEISAERVDGRGFALAEVARQLRVLRPIGQTTTLRVRAVGVAR